MTTPPETNGDAVRLIAMLAQEPTIEPDVRILTIGPDNYVLERFITHTPWRLIRQEPTRHRGDPT